MIKIESTKNYAQTGVKCLVYSHAGIGKTVLCSTAPDPFIISSESGLLSLADHDISMTEIKTVEDLGDVYNWAVSSKEAEKFKTICLDSISEICETLLSTFKAEERDARQAYGRMNDSMSSMIRKFRDLKDKHVYFTAKLKSLESEDTGIVRNIPSMPGKTLLNELPYFFDELFVLRLGKLEDGTVYRYLQTNPTIKFEAKDRSGKLNNIEKPDLTYVFNKIINKEVKKKEITKELITIKEGEK